MMRTINAVDYGLIGDNQTDNSLVLNELLASCADFTKTIIYVPVGTYRFHEVVMRSNVDFRFSAGAVFKGLDGTQNFFRYFTNNDVHNVVWRNATFEGTIQAGNFIDGLGQCNHDMRQAHEVYFYNCTFNRCQAKGCHVLDLQGSYNIFIFNSKFIGYGQAGEVNQNYSDKETIQLDYNDNQTTHHVYVINCQFLPAYDTTGKVLAWAGNPIGQHGDNPKQPICHIIFTNNYVLDPIPVFDNKIKGTLHFPVIQGLVIANNKFERQQGFTSPTYIQLWDPLGNHADDPIEEASDSLYIGSNNFVNVDPTVDYIHFGVGTSATASHLGINNAYIANNQFESVKTVNVLSQEHSQNQFNIVQADNSLVTTIADNNGQPVEFPNDFNLVAWALSVDANFQSQVVMLREFEHQLYRQQWLQQDITDKPLLQFNNLNRTGYLAVHLNGRVLKQLVNTVINHLNQLGSLAESGYYRTRINLTIPIGLEIDNNYRQMLVEIFTKVQQIINAYLNDTGLAIG